MLSAATSSLVGFPATTPVGRRILMESSLIAFWKLFFFLNRKASHPNLWGKLLHLRKYINSTKKRREKKPSPPFT